MDGSIKNARKLAQNAQDSLKNYWGNFRNIIQKIFVASSDWVRKILLSVAGALRNLVRFFKELLKKIIYSPIFLCITFSSAVALVYKLILQYDLISLLPQVLIDDFITMQEFINWLGIPYSFLISMTLLRAWERADDVSKCLRKEAHSIAILVDSVHLNPLEPNGTITVSRERIISCIENYVSHVEDSYDSEYEDLSLKHEGDEKLRAIECELNLKLWNLPELAELKLDQKMSDIIAARRDRLFNSKGRMPALIWSLLLASSILWLFLFVSVSFGSPWLGFLLIFGITFIVITIIVTILLFNEPTSIRWNDISNSWKKLRIKIHSIKEVKEPA